MASSSILVTRGGAGGQSLVHSPEVSPAVERLVARPGEIRGSTVVDIGDITAFTDINAGTLTIGDVTVQGIDLSAASTIQEVFAALTAALQSDIRLTEYRCELWYANPGAGGDGQFYGRLIHDGGDVPAVAGTIEPLLGWAVPAASTAYAAASPPIVFPGSPTGGHWNHLAFRAVGQTYAGAYWTFLADVWRVDGATVSTCLSFTSGGAWRTQNFHTAEDGAIVVGIIEVYNLRYFSVIYTPATRTLSWRADRDLPDATSWAPSINTLTVMGR